MSKIPTAEEWLSNHKDLSVYDVASYDEGGYVGVDERALYQIMTEFAKMHVESALKAASQNAQISVYKKSIFAKDSRWKKTEEPELDLFSYEVMYKPSKSSIVKSYPLTNIK